MKRLMLIVSVLLFPGLARSQTTWSEQEFNRGDLSRDWTDLRIEIDQAMNATP